MKSGFLDSGRTSRKLLKTINDESEEFIVFDANSK
jgi:hypothetical protein